LYFLAESASDQLRNQMGADVSRWTSLLVVALGGLWTAGWLMFLRPSGEKESINLHHAPAPEFEARVLKQLGSLNTYLDRSVKK
jgi:hypothetical protein